MNQMSGMTTTRSKPWLQPWILPQTNPSCCAPLSQLKNLANGFAPISLEEMDGVALLDRTDTKFAMNSSNLLKALSCLQEDYWILEVNAHRLNHYRTLYFDTPNFELYQAHVNQRPERYKVRSREYADSHLSFLEVKHKTRKDRTIKERISTSQPVVQITPDLENWLQTVCPLDGHRLQPKLWNTFTRITLVNKHCCERVTLDTDLIIATDDKWMRLDGMAVAEVKIDTAATPSRFLYQMRAQRIRSDGFSKYAIGVALLNDQVKKNTLKPRLLWVEKMLKGSEYHG
jgi:hypothetical protein